MYIYFFPRSECYHKLNNLVNSLIAVRFAKVNELIGPKQFSGDEGRNDMLDYARVTDVIEELTRVYTDEEEEVFLRQGYPKVECCIQAYNYNGYGCGRNYSLDTYKDFKHSQEVYTGSNYKAIMYFYVYLELDKLDKIFWNTQAWDFWSKCRDEVMSCQN
jgi:hypothetical protein